MSREELRRLIAGAGVRQKPWELYDGNGITYSIFGRHPGEEYDDENLPCRITTGGDFDDIESARLAVEAVNALPTLLDRLNRCEALLTRWRDASLGGDAADLGDLTNETTDLLAEGSE